MRMGRLVPVSLRLTRPLACVDLETTGTFPTRDFIVQFAVVKLYPDGKETAWKTYVNPRVPIPSEATEVHGIRDADVADAPTFRELAPKIAAGLANCDIAGYNVGDFDIKFLQAEFQRARFPMPTGLLDGAVVDAFRLFQRHEPRTLEAAVRFYLGPDVEYRAHDALEDARLSLRVLEAQLERYGLPDTAEELAKLCERERRPDWVDPQGKLVRRGIDVLLTFGKNAGRALSEVDRGYLDWLCAKDFSAEVKAAARAELDRRCK